MTTVFAGFITSATLHIWQAHQSVHLCGDLERDYKNRFKSDCPIRTSDIQQIVYKEGLNCTDIHTRNSTYVVMGNLLADYGLEHVKEIDGTTLVEMHNAGTIELHPIYGGM